MAVVAVWASSAWATRCYPAGQNVAPPEGAQIPANTPLFVAPARSEYPERQDDGGIELRVFNESLTRSDVGPLIPVDGGDRSTQFYAPGALQVGHIFFLEDAGIPVTVVPASPFPSRAGTMAFGPIFLGATWCSFEGLPRKMARDVYVQLSPEAEPWRHVAQVRVNRPAVNSRGESFAQFPFPRPYGTLGAAEAGLGIPIGPLIVDCDTNPGRHEFELEMRFEIAGAPTQAEPIRQTVVMDCADRPPVSCSHAPLLMVALSMLMLRRRTT